MCFKMSIETLKLEKGLCRCCHNEGVHKNLAEPWLKAGGVEIYADMLQSCLDINLTPLPGPHCTVTYTICEACIERLRDAWSFKQQVNECERQFREYYSKSDIKLGSGVDIEVKRENIDDEDVKLDLSPIHDDDDFRLDDFDVDDETKVSDVDIKSGPRKLRHKKAKAPEKAKAKSKPARKPKDEAAKDPESRKKGDMPCTPKFRLRNTDYTTDGDVYKCSKCQKAYEKTSSLKYHVRTKHYKIPRYPCPYCEEGFMTPAPLTVHKLKEHNVDDRFKCNACKGTFNTKVQLRKHINNFHMLGEKYKCEFCEYESFSFEGLYKHKFKHKTVKDYHCRFCRKAFLRKTTLDLHERIHTGDRRKVCTVCSKAFVQKASLNYHMTKYHPEVNY